MTITPGTPDDWTDTVEPKRAEAFVEYLSRDIGYNLCHYASPRINGEQDLVGKFPNASHRMGEGCQCRPSRIPHVVPIAPDSARPATLTPEQPVKAPGQDGDLFLTRGTPVEVEWPSGSRSSVYVDEGGYQLIAGHVGDRTPLPWGDARIVRVLTEDKPAQEPVLPRRIKPADVRVGMVVERRKGEAAVRARAEQIDGGLIKGDGGWVWLWMPRHAELGWTLWLVEDAPEPEDPDAEALDQMAQAMANLDGSDDADEWVPWAEVALDALRETHDVTPRAEQ